MRLPRDLSGRRLAACLSRHWGYIQVHQTGSHLILDTEDPHHQRITVPSHKTLKVGTLNAILRAVAHHKGVERSAILDTL